MKLENDNCSISLDDLLLFSLTGNDVENYLQGQTTQDMAKISSGQFKMAARLDRSGRVKSFFYVVRIEKEFQILVHAHMAESLIQELNQFIISEDVTIKGPLRPPYLFYLGNPSAHLDGIRGFMFGQEGLLIKHESARNDLRPASQMECRRLEFFSSLAEKLFSVENKELINNTSLFDTALALNKGCYLGQETVNKIYNGRSAPKTPCIFVTETPSTVAPVVASKVYCTDKEIGVVIDQLTQDRTAYFLLRLDRSFGVEGLNLNLKILEQVYDGTITLISKLKDLDFETRAKSLFEEAVKLFHQGEKSQAKEVLKQALDYNPGDATAIETIGVMLGQEGKYHEALDWMDKLLEVDPKSLMAHTNKSLYYMKLGQIELAEEEKSKATLINFELLGKEAEDKKASEAKKREDELALDRKAEMFKKVLALDSEDEFACLGLAEILLAQKKYIEILDLLSQPIKLSKIKASAYFFYSSALFKLDRKDEAREFINAGLEKSKQRGEMQIYAKLQELLKANG